MGDRFIMNFFENIEWKQERIEDTKELTDKVSSLLDFLIENSVKYPEILSLNKKICNLQSIYFVLRADI